MAFQGYLADGQGVALGNNAPKNYNIVFRVWNDPSSTGVANKLWTEQQTVTVDKGYFSVLLGEGSAYGGEPHASVSSLFAASDASDRYVECTVRGIGTGGADVIILPRLRLLSSAYSFLAKSAGKLVSGSGADLLTSGGGGVTVNGAVTASSYNGPLNGANLTATSVTGAKLANGAVGAAQIATGAVGTTQLASGAVTATQIAAGAVGTTQLAAGAVTTTQIAAGAVGTAQLATGAVASGQIANGTIVDVDVSTNFAIWNKSTTNIYYSGANVSVGIAGTPKSLTVTSNLTVAGNLILGIGNPLTYHPPLIVESKTPTNQTVWDIKEVDVSAFATNSLCGFKIRVYAQHELASASYQVRNYEGTMLFEQPGYVTNPDYPAKFIQGSVSWTGNYDRHEFTLGNPAVGGGPFDQLLGAADGWLNIYDFNPASLNGGVNSKPTLPIYHIWFAFNPQVSGRIVISDN